MNVKVVMGVVTIFLPLSVVFICAALIIYSSGKQREYDDKKGKNSVEYISEVSRGRLYLCVGLGSMLAFFIMLYVKKLVLREK